MGRAMRWLKNLFGGGGNKESKSKQDNSGHPREKSRRSFVKPWREADDGGAAQASASAAAALVGSRVWLRSLYADSEKEQSKHAIAVAAATAAAADAAVAAAQAAVAVVRLTDRERGTLVLGGRERSAAVKIQTAFRAYLARKALRALKALVKLQALVRGYLVRKQAAYTLHSMQALMRAQATVRKKRSPAAHSFRFHPEFRPRRSLQEKYDETRSENSASVHSRRLSDSLDPSNSFDESPKVVEVDHGARPKSRSGGKSLPLPAVETSNVDLPPPHLPHRLRSAQEPEWSLVGDECRFATANNTPRLGGMPHYMGRTRSSSVKAMVRSQSAPKQRPEPRRRRQQQSRASLSGAGMERSCSAAQEAVGLRGAVVGKLLEGNREYGCGRRRRAKGGDS